MIRALLYKIRYILWGRFSVLQKIALFRPLLELFDKTFNWVAHRTFDKFNIVKIRTLTPGYYDQDTRLLHASFELLIDHLEEESVMFSSTHKGQATRDLILKHLDWEMSLDDPETPEDERSPFQAGAAKVKKELYLWWTEGRPNRIEPWQDVVNGQLKGRDALDIEIEFYEEDNRMLRKLIDVRATMWI